MNGSMKTLEESRGRFGAALARRIGLALAGMLVMVAGGWPTVAAQGAEQPKPVRLSTNLTLTEEEAGEVKSLSDLRRLFRRKLQLAIDREGLSLRQAITLEAGTHSLREWMDQAATSADCHWMLDREQNRIVFQREEPTDQAAADPGGADGEAEADSPEPPPIEGSGGELRKIESRNAVPLAVLASQGGTSVTPTPNPASTPRPTATTPPPEPVAPTPEPEAAAGAATTEPSDEAFVEEASSQPLTAPLHGSAPAPGDGRPLLLPVEVPEHLQPRMPPPTVEEATPAVTPAVTPTPTPTPVPTPSPTPLTIVLEAPLPTPPAAAAEDPSGDVSSAEGRGEDMAPPTTTTVLVGPFGSAGVALAAAADLRRDGFLVGDVAPDPAGAGESFVVMVSSAPGSRPAPESGGASGLADSLERLGYPLR
jgi:hypothetical protein